MSNIEVHRDTLKDIFFSLCEIEDINTAHATFFKAGKRLAPKLGTSIDEVVDNIQRMGWGRIKVIKLKNKYKFELYDSLFFGIESDKGVCAFYSGIFAGIIERTEHKRTVVIERECVGKGDRYCSFETITP